MGCIKEAAGSCQAMEAHHQAAVSSQTTLNGMQQGTPQEHISLQQPRVQQRLNSSEDDAPIAQQRAQPRPQVQSRPAPQLRTPFGLNSPPLPQASSDSSSGLRRARPQQVEPSFNELRREALAREPEAA